ncbi:hypothetical protein NPIL_371121 [Nephila pilipes]|uniref:Uncharacterized protein n=1 Tax=Nephila pilipes TaxID=299642 RepID=A0A8X6TJD9_NEPPI|nr:hypothetical protein NPIL_371121 [Nephila pilipes]
MQIRYFPWRFENRSFCDASRQRELQTYKAFQHVGPLIMRGIGIGLQLRYQSSLFLFWDWSGIADQETRESAQWNLRKRVDLVKSRFFSHGHGRSRFY